MKDLKCSLRQCKHNKHFNCFAKSITVDEEADCKAYSPEAGRNSDLLFEIGSIEAPPPLIDTEVKCTATSCAFNRSRICVANGITVLSAKTVDKAECATYLKR